MTVGMPPGFDDRGEQIARDEKNALTKAPTSLPECAPATSCLRFLDAGQLSARDNRYCRRPKTTTENETARAVGRRGWRQSQVDSATGRPV